MSCLMLTLRVTACYREYYPQNIMFDKRVHRGNSYAAMVIPAGTSHDTMIMEKRQTQKARQHWNTAQAQKADLYFLGARPAINAPALAFTMDEAA